MNIKFDDKLILEKKYQEEISTLRQEIKTLSDKLDAKHKDYNNQYGGKRNIVKYNGLDYEFSVNKQNESIMYVLRRKKSKNITIIINKKIHQVYIHNLSNEKNCIILGHIVEKGGMHLVNIALKLISNLKKKYGLKYVLLTDNSIKLMVKE